MPQYCLVIQQLIDTVSDYGMLILYLDLPTTRYYLPPQNHLTPPPR